MSKWSASRVRQLAAERLRDVEDAADRLLDMPNRGQRLADAICDGEVLLRAGHHVAAVSSFDFALAGLDDHPINTPHLLRALSGKASALIRAGSAAAALAAANDALALPVDLGRREDRWYLARAMREKGRALAMLGEHAAARETNLDIHLRFGQDTDSEVKRVAANAFILGGEQTAALGDYAAALQIADEAITRSSARNDEAAFDGNLRFRALLLRWAALTHLGRHEEAAEVQDIVSALAKNDPDKTAFRTRFQGWSERLGVPKQESSDNAAAVREG